MLQTLVAKQREWKEKNYHYLQEQICAIVTGPPGALLFDRDQRSH